MTDSLELDLEGDIFGDDDLGSSDMLQPTQPASAQPSTASVVGEKRKREPDAPAASTSVPAETDPKRTVTSASRLNQAQTSVTAPPLPVGSTSSALVDNSNEPTITAKNLGLPADLNNIKVVLATNTQSKFSSVSIYMVNLESKDKKIEGAKELLTRYRKRAALLDPKEADQKIGLANSFRIAYMEVRGAILNTCGSESEMAKPKTGEPDFSVRTHVLWLGPSTNPIDAKPRAVKTAAGTYVRMPSIRTISTQTVVEIKKLITHLFGEIFDGLPYGTETLRRVCLVNVLNQMKQDHPGSVILNEKKPESTAGTLDDVDEAPMLQLASGEMIGLKNNKDVYARVRELFISKGIAPIKMHTNNKELRKTVPWHDPRADTLVLTRKVFRKMNELQEKQAKEVQPGQSRPVWGSWPIGKPAPTKEDFDNPEKAKECESYANSCGYVLSPIIYITQNGAPYVLPPNVEKVDDAHAEEENDASSSTSLDDTHDTASPADDGLLTFVYKRPPQKPRVLTITSIAGADLRLRLWATEPGQNPDGAYGAHLDLASTKVMVIERRVSESNSKNIDIESQYGAQISEEDYVNMLPHGEASDFLPM